MPEALASEVFKAPTRLIAVGALMQEADGEDSPETGSIVGSFHLLGSLNKLKMNF